LAKHTFHRLVKVTLLLRLLSANCQPGWLPPIHLSSLPLLVVCLILLSSCCATSTSHRFEVPPAFKMPPPLVRWCLQLIVTMPLVAPLPLLILSTIHRLLSANASPPVGLLFARWLLCHPCSCSAAASCPLDTPPPLVLSTHRLHLETSRLHLATCPCFLSDAASPLVCLSFTGWFSHIILSRHRLKCPSLTPPFIHTGWLLRLILSHCFCLPSSFQHYHFLMRWQLTSRLPLICPNWLPVCLTWYS
jgi:hypothetical protein